jgi:hypothetical protein
MIMYGNGFGVGFAGGSHGVISEASFPMSVMVFSFSLASRAAAHWRSGNGLAHEQVALVSFLWF